MKFITIERFHNGLINYITIIFDKFIAHSYMASFSIEMLKLQSEFNPDVVFTVVSAGFFNKEYGDFYGESESLKISSHIKSKEACDSADYNFFYNQNNKLIK